MNFNDLFRNINVPIIIYRDGADMTVVYENASAIRLLNPLSKQENWQYIDERTTIKDLLQIPDEKFQEIVDALKANENITNLDIALQLYSGETVYAKLAGNKFVWDGIAYIQLSLNILNADATQADDMHALRVLFDLSFKAQTPDEAINKLLAFAGEYINVSRSYIFEAISEVTTSNTYEWCAPGIEAAIDQLQDLPKDEYSYDNIINNGVAVTDDIRSLSDEDREILEPQGIKSMALIPIFSSRGPLGYVGFDDCQNYRKWAQNEIQLLQSIADLISSLLLRRDAERSMYYSLEILDTVTNSLDSSVYVVDLHTDKILFANNAFAGETEIPVDEMIGMDFMKALESCSENILAYNPNSIMLDEDGKIKERNHTWEFYNERKDKWFLVRDAIVGWIDGRDVRIETATDITHQKKHEAQLEYFASTDIMTGTYNREWCKKMLGNILEIKSNAPVNSLVFMDLDGLKQINDTYGHADGDHMILKTVEVIKSCIRKSDVLCRWGGDEFVMIVRAAEEQTHIVMKKILDKLNEYNATGEKPFKLSFSYGITEIFPGSGQTITSLITEVDEKMYANKQQKIK